MNRSVIFLQPYLAEYRLPLYEALDSRLSDAGLTLLVYHGRPSTQQARRRDEVTAPWARSIRSLGSAGLVLRRVDGRRTCAAMVSELSVHNVDAWLAPLIARGPLQILWGHGASYVTDDRPMKQRLRARLAHRADAVWTYTEGGRSALLARGVPAGRVVAVGNASDNHEVRLHLQNGLRDRAAEIARDLGVSLGHTALYIGGLDAEKGAHLLPALARAAGRLDPSFTLIVAGEGSLREAFRDAPHVMHVGRVRSERKAELLAVSDALWAPGRVGLVALDALAARIPLVTFADAAHAPEIEFLQSEQEVFFLPERPAEFAGRALEIPTAATFSSEMPTAETVAERMTASLFEHLGIR